MSMKDAYLKMLQAQLDEWDAEIEKLKANADKFQEESRLEYYKQFENVRQQQKEAQAKLEELRQSSEDAWEDLKAGMENAWDDLGKAVKSALSGL